MANLNNTSPIARITHLNGLTVCQTNDGTVVVPIQWDYVAWTPMAERFITALKAALSILLLPATWLLLLVWYLRWLAKH